MFKSLFALLAALALAAPLYAGQASGPPPGPACPQGDRAAPRGPGAVCLDRLTESYAFSFAYPAEAAAIPVIDALLRDEAAQAEARFAGIVAAYRNAGFSDPPGRMHYEAEWQLDAALPEVIALSGAAGVHIGGAHGGIEYRTILLDRRRNRPIRLAELFDLGPFEHDFLGHRPVGVGAVQRAFCRALIAEVRARRDQPAAAVACPDIELQPLTFVCGGRGRIEAMRALLNPYVVGSWAEGPYEVDFPVDALMIAAMKRRFRNAFGPPGEERGRIPPRPCR